MGIFGAKKRSPGSFWLKPPIPSRDPEVLYHYGVTCYTKDDGPGMISSGWAIWGISGLHSHQANKLLTDGFAAWQRSTSYERAVGVAFLEALFKRLSSMRAPACPADPWSAPRELVEPASAYFSLLCWSGSELISEARTAGSNALVSEYEPVIYQAICAVPYYFVPPRSIDEARTYAANNGWPAPWAR